MELAVEWLKTLQVHRTNLVPIANECCQTVEAISMLKVGAGIHEARGPMDPKTDLGPCRPKCAQQLA